jgi:thiamine monophosphate kinase
VKRRAIKTHYCGICRQKKLHGAVCAVTGYLGFTWICLECIEKTNEQQKGGDGDAER